MGTTKKDPQKVSDLFAFWPYDTFPFMLGARVVEMREDGRVVAEGYTGLVFTPFKLMPREAGEKLWKQVETMRVDHRKAVSAVHAEWHAKLRDLVPFLPKKGVGEP